MMTRETSRRAVLRLGGVAGVVGVSGCLRQATSQSDGGTGADGQPTASAATTGADSTAGQPATAAGQLATAWQLDVAGGSVAAADGTFFLSSQDPARLLAVDSTGSERWRNDDVPASTRNGLAVSETALTVCGQEGTLAVVDRQSGEVQWTFTETTYAGWRGAPMMTDAYVVALNQETGETDRQRLYVFDRAAGDVVLTKDYEMALGVAISGSRAFVITTNHLDIYDVGADTRTDRVTEFIGGPVAFINDRLYVGATQFLSAHELTTDSTTNAWNTDVRGEPVAIQATADAVYVGGQGGVYVISADGERQWWGETEQPVGQPAVGRETVFATTAGRQLYAFGTASGDQVGRIELSEDSPPQPSVAAAGNTAVIMGATAHAVTRQSDT